MNNHRTRIQTLFTIAAFILTMNISGCGLAQANLSKLNILSLSANDEINRESQITESDSESDIESNDTNATDVNSNTSTFATSDTDGMTSDIASTEKTASGMANTGNTASKTDSKDITAPVIDASDLEIPYGTHLYLKNIATISDDQDKSPILEITSIHKQNTDGFDKADTTAEGATNLTATSAASTADTASENASAITPAKDESETKLPDETTSTAEEATSSTPSSTADTASPGTAATEPAAYNSDTALPGQTSSPAEDSTTITASSTATTANTSSENAAVAKSDDDETDSPSTDRVDNSYAEQSNIGSTSAEVAAEQPPAQENNFENGYLFSDLGVYIIDLTGTDQSGNQSQKSINVTVVDSIAPVLSGLHENYVITDQDKNPPNYLEGIVATDEIDGDLSSLIKVDDSKVKYGNPGTYSIVYSVADSAGNTATAATPVIINDTTAPAITLSKSTITLFVTDSKPDYTAYVSAIDSVDGDVKDNLTINDKDVKYTCPGTYSAILLVKDKSGNSAECSIKLNITAGWKTENGKKYYFDPDDGHMHHKWSKIDGLKYYFDPNDGHLLTGLQTIDDKQYLLDEKDGHRLTGWQTIDGKKYCFSKNDGHMYHGLREIDGSVYYFDPDDGHLVTGWKMIDGKQYFFDLDDGHMHHSWTEVNGSKYYFDPDNGYMYTGTHTVDGEQYDFGTDGVAEKVVVQQRSSIPSSPSEYSYIGNRNSKVFHHSWCASVRKMKESNKVGFGSRDDAMSSGYRPCKNCNP